MEITFGKYKGLTIKQIAEIGEEGINYLRWMKELPIDPKFKFLSEKRNSAIIEVLNQYQLGNIEFGPETEVKVEPPPKVQAPPVKENFEMTSIKFMANALDQLIRIEKNTRPVKNICTPEEVSWDD